MSLNEEDLYDNRTPASHKQMWAFKSDVGFLEQLGGDFDTAIHHYMIYRIEFNPVMHIFGVVRFKKPARIVRLKEIPGVIALGTIKKDVDPIEYFQMSNGHCGNCFVFGEQEKKRIPKTYTSIQGNHTPVQPNNTSVQENFSPVQENFSPVQENFSPVQENFSPVQENFSPVLNSTTPITNSTTPITNSTTPVQKNSASNKNFFVKEKRKYTKKIKVDNNYKGKQAKIENKVNVKSDVIQNDAESKHVGADSEHVGDEVVAQVNTSQSQEKAKLQEKTPEKDDNTSLDSNSSLIAKELAYLSQNQPVSQIVMKGTEGEEETKATMEQKEDVSEPKKENSSSKK